MWNRHGNPLSISKDFSEALETLQGCDMEWLDTEALERRHNIGRGTLIVLDVIAKGVPYEDRKAMAAKFFPNAPLDPSAIAENQVYTSPYFTGLPLSVWLYESLRQYRGFFEGIVMKRSGSSYSFQTRSDGKETVDWVKHRYA
jgi:hypothetical protein